MDVKIISWKSKGLRVPDWEIDIDPENGKKTSVLMMPSGMGKTTTLNLLRFSFCDYSNILEKKNISSFQKSKSKEDKGEFVLNIKVNNEKYRIKTIFDFNKKSLSYETTDPIDGTLPGLNLPEEIKKYLDQEYIEKTFFDLELVDDLFESTAAIDSINKLYKLYYFDQVSNALDSYLVKKQNESETENISRRELEELKNYREKLFKKRDELITENEKNKTEYENLKKEKKKYEKIKDDIESSKKSIKEKFDTAREKISLAKNDLKRAYDDYYLKIRNPMLINKDFKEKLINFEKNLNNLKIPESVGKAFFDDLIKANQCLCGHEMNEEMKKKILESKESILSEDTWLILSVLKHKIRKESDNEIIDLNDAISLIAEKKQILSIEERKENEIVEGIDDKKYDDAKEKLLKINEKIQLLDDFFKKYNEAPSKQDTPDDNSINKINNLLEIVGKKIGEATKTEKISSRIKVIKDVFKKTQQKSLNFLTNDLVEKINKEIPRVMPFEKVFVKDIKDKITLEGKDSGSAGQQARIAYLFLIKLLDRPNFNFPFIVDSPATAMDDVSREEIATTIATHLNNQYIGLILPTEKTDFVDVLEKKTNNKINLIVAFNTIEKETSNLIQLAKKYNISKKNNEEFIVSKNNKEFFWEFKTNIKNNI
ncbi:hypothetical protein [Candidatus Pelagibacter sp. HIMB1587]|uniref:hypothetical protein n=1 Tax=Candidatus Pelagibacter sp. HIMB1587 TaxID=3413354 RepID=UPI003F8541F0